MLTGTKFKRIIFYILLAFLLIGCSTSGETPTSQPGQVTAPVLAPTLTPTLPPLAVKVNNSHILLSDFEEEVHRYKDALQFSNGNTITDQEIGSIVLDDLINQTLLSDAAVQSGFKLSDEELQKRIDDLSNTLGNTTTFQDWLDQNHYNLSSFTRMYRLALLSSWERNTIFESVPQVAEQVHARQLYFQDENEARSYHQQLLAGADFIALASELDPITAGELGWFPRGYLYQPEVEDAAYKLQPGEFSDVITSQIGYHIVQVIEKEMDRALDPEQRTTLQEKELQGWIDDQREKSSITIFIE